MGRLLIFDQGHRLFRHRQRQPGLSDRGLWQFGRGFVSRRGNRLQHWLGDWQHNGRRLCLWRWRWFRNWLWLFDGGFLRLFAQPSEQAFLFASRSWGLLVVVGTKHGGRLSHGSDAPTGAPANKYSMQNRLRLTQLVHAQHFVEALIGTSRNRLLIGLKQQNRRKSGIQLINIHLPSQTQST